MNIKNQKNRELYKQYSKRIKRNYIYKRIVKTLIGGGLIGLMIYARPEHFPVSFTDYLYGVLLILLAFVGLIVFLKGLIDSNDTQYNKKVKDLRKLKFEYSRYLERERIRENHTHGLLEMDWCSDARFKFD